MTNDTKLILNAIQQFQFQVSSKFLEYDKKFDAIDKRFDAYDKRFDAIDKRFDAYDKKFDAIDKRFDTYDKRFDASEERSNTIQNQLNSLENIVTRMEIEHGNKIQLLLEQTCFLIEQHKEIKESINELNSKFDNHEIRIQILEEKIL